MDNNKGAKTPVAIAGHLHSSQNSISVSTESNQPDSSTRLIPTRDTRSTPQMQTGSFYPAEYHVRSPLGRFRMQITRCAHLTNRSSDKCYHETYKQSRPTSQPTTAFRLRASRNAARSSFLTSTMELSKLSILTRASVSSTTS